MDFNDSEAEASYRREVRAFLQAQAPAYESDTKDEQQLLQKARAWQAVKADAGFGCITWPEEWGGVGGSALQQIIFSEEEARYALPSGFFQVGLGMCLPTIMTVADELTKRRFVRPAMRGEEIWCQLFSEPAAGSDLAAVRTRATREGDVWVVDGQKVWTTVAHVADYGLLLARTDFTLPKHKGLTMFWLDMRSPGIEVRPIHQISGKSSFNEVFLDGVRIPDAQRLGQSGAGWGVALVTLMNERLAVGGARGPDTRDIIRLARSIPTDRGSALEDPAFRDRLADWHVQSTGLNLNRLRMLTALSRGETPSVGASIGKIVATQLLQEETRELLDIFDQFGMISDPALAPMEGDIHRLFLQVAGSRLAGGTDEILKNVIAERVLGLPGEPRIDKDKPFNEVPVGSR
jgi:alkylation response protein AidB-like acyl-CoA dehydrogenase